VWSISFIRREALDCPASNKQHPTPVWNMPMRGIDCHTSDEGLLFLDALKLSRFLFKDKSENTFIYM